MRIFLFILIDIKITGGKIESFFELDAKNNGLIFQDFPGISLLRHVR